MRSILYIGTPDAARAARIAALEAERMDVTTRDRGDAAELQSADVVVYDGAGLTEADLDMDLEAFAPTAPMLVIHDSPRHLETPLRDRRDALLAGPAGDTMRSEDSADELVTRVRALLLRSAPTRVLILEDEPKIAEWAAAELAREGHIVETVDTIAKFRTAFAAAPFDVLVTDRMLPDGDGIELVREMRAKGIRTPILVYTALKEFSEWDMGRDVGADDYVGKPIDAEELRARVRYVLRPKAGTLQFGPLEFILDEKRVIWRGEPLHLSDKGRGGRTEYALFAYLAERHDLNIPIRMLLQDIWNQPFPDPDSNPAYTAKRRLTKRLETLGLPKDIIVSKDGTYRFDPAPLLTIDAPDENPK